MDSISWLQLVSYVFFPLSLLFIVVAYTAQVVKYAMDPIHLRWELYPIPHERGWKYGGSYFEEFEWWPKPRKKNFIRDITTTVNDYLFFTQYFSRNRGLWYFLYPFHIGLYSIVAVHILLFFGALLMVSGLSISADSASIWGKGIYWLTLMVGVGGFAIGIVGCIGLFVRRVVDENLRVNATPLNYFSPLFYLAVLATGLYAWYFSDPTFSGFREFMKSLITFTFVANIDLWSAIHIILFSLLLIYMPLFTPALHYATKYFTFFKVRWDDEPTLRGSEVEKKIGKLLNQTVTWSAPHIQSGKKWAEVATEVKFPDKREAK